MKACLIVGTRPQIIKSQPIINKFKKRRIKLFVIHTGQHYDYKMSKSFFDELEIPNPDYNLGISKGSSAKQLGEIISKLELRLKKINPDVVIVPGDTRSALGGALAANSLGIPIAHIESGARSYDPKMEEETNRRLIDHMSSYLFAPTPNCLKNLKSESVLGKISLSGDTMYDVFLQYKKILKLTNKKENFILMTIHRRENILNKKKISGIISTARKLSKHGHNVVFPIHPHTKKQIKSYGLSLTGIKVISPLKYSEILKMISKSSLLITDSGGLQKEAFWLNTHCVTIRENTEWIETLKSKNNQLLTKITPNDHKKIEKILGKKFSGNKTKLFGNGNASDKIVSILSKQF